MRYRPLSRGEGRKPQRITVRLRRAIVVLMTAQGQTVRDITSLLQVSVGISTNRPQVPADWGIPRS